MDWSQINEYDEFKHGLVYLPTSMSYWKNCPNASRILDYFLSISSQRYCMEMLE